MKKKNIFVINFTARGEGEGDSTFTQSDIDSAIAAAVSKTTDDLNSKLGGKNKELLSELKKLKEQNSKFDGIDPDKFKTMMATFENDQDLKDISEGKVQDVIDRKLERERANYSSQLESLEKERDDLKSNYESSQSKITDLMINNNVVSEFVKQKGVEDAIPDVVLRAKTMFRVEGDEVIARNSSGEIITGKNGPMTIEEWVTGLKESAKHLFPGSTGSGASGGGPSGDQNMDTLRNAARSGNMANYRKLRGSRN